MELNYGYDVEILTNVLTWQTNCDCIHINIEPVQHDLRLCLTDAIIEWLHCKPARATHRHLIIPYKYLTADPNFFDRLKQVSIAHIFYNAGFVCFSLKFFVLLYAVIKYE